MEKVFVFSRTGFSKKSFDARRSLEFVASVFSELNESEKRAEWVARVQRLAFVGARRVLQRGGAAAVDRLGIGRQGVRLTVLGDVHEAEIPHLTTLALAEAADRLSRRALRPVFSETAERSIVTSQAIRWLDLNAANAVSGGGSMLLHWSVAERESFRREVLNNQKMGAELTVTAAVISHSGRRVAEVEMTWRAWARPPIGEEGDQQWGR